MIVLGSTGSIGTNTLSIAEEFGLDVEVLVAGSNIELLKKQIERFGPKIVTVAKKKDAELIDAPVVLWGEEGIIEAIKMAKSSIVVNALVGFLGLRPTLTSIELGKEVALANKESLVVAGKFIDRTKITPIDSEHFGLWYLLNGKKVSKMVITASGGAFRDWEVERIKRATFKEALNHPNWSMGYKITIDSATMVNKLFELLEAYWLFGCKNLDALIERNSIVHALIQFADGSTTLHASRADMRLPIAWALLKRVEKEIVEPVDFTDISLRFSPIDQKRYPIWKIKEELLAHPDMGVVVNAANEVAIEEFKEGRIGFFDIPKKIIQAFERFKKQDIKRLEDVFEIDKEVREYVKGI